MMKRISTIYRTVALMIIGAAFVLEVSAIPARPEPPRLVNDFAGLFSDRQTALLENELVAFDDTPSNQITVVTVRSLEGYDASEYATRIGLEWQVGSEKFDNGVVMLVKPKTAFSDGEIFIAVGYGLEGAIPDAYAKRIIEEVIIPHFREGDYFEGVAAGCDVLMKLASGEISELREDDDEAGLIAGIVAITFICILVFVILLAHENGKGGGHGGNGGSGGRGVYTGPIIIGRPGGGSFGGGSSFGGGFGGFGGGSFGGGGAGGRW